jgi:hypothetical protein
VEFLSVKRIVRGGTAIRAVVAIYTAAEIRFFGYQILITTAPENISIIL